MKLQLALLQLDSARERLNILITPDAFIRPDRDGNGSTVNDKEQEQGIYETLNRGHRYPNRLGDVVNDEPIINGFSEILDWIDH